MGIVFVLVLVGFVGFVFWRKSQNKKSTDNYNLSNDSTVAGKPDIDVGDTVKPAKK